MGPFSLGFAIVLAGVVPMNLNWPKRAPMATAG
jgi:hypothetical protein